MTTICNAKCKSTDPYCRSSIANHQTLDSAFEEGLASLARRDSVVQARRRVRTHQAEALRADRTAVAAVQLVRRIDIVRVTLHDPFGRRIGAAAEIAGAITDAGIAAIGKNMLIFTTVAALTCHKCCYIQRCHIYSIEQRITKELGSELQRCDQQCNVQTALTRCHTVIWCTIVFPHL